ncbi:type II secretion system protein N [Microbulbifer sp. ARAS458-1]|uniref:type II secretion system protein N n=1 Tax=Microbulbifer sp. ARAS458-1 TaxID=3140242 RepID=UPI0038780570
MTAVKRVIASILRAAVRNAETKPRKLLPLHLVASTGVVAGWLAINFLAYGASVFTSSGGDVLLVQRAAIPGSAASAGLPDTPFFGRAQAEAQNQRVVNLENIPVTQLQLVLSGVLGNSSGAQGSALIAEKGKPAQRYYVGDQLPGGAEVYKVAVDHIVLSLDGKMEKLTYPDEDGRPNVPLPKDLAHRSYQKEREVVKSVEAIMKSDSSPAQKQQSILERVKELKAIASQRKGGESN